MVKETSDSRDWTTRCGQCTETDSNLTKVEAEEWIVRHQKETGHDGGTMTSSTTHQTM
jgi:hypothetical protein